MSGRGEQVDVISRQLARRPAVAAAIVFGAGIALHSRLPVWPWIWIVLAALLWISAIVNRREGVLASASLGLALGLLGTTLAQLRANAFAPHDLAHYTAAAPRLVLLEMRIDDPPRILTRQFDAFLPLPPRQVCMGHVMRVHLEDGWAPVTGRVLVQIEPPHPALRAGQLVRIRGMLQRPTAALNPGEFDWAAYYREQRILASLQVRSPAAITPVDPGAARWITGLRQRVRDALALGFDSRHALDHALLRALLLGDSDPELQDVQERFRRTGTSHHLAISGLHIAVLGGFVLLICRLAAIPPRISAVVVAIFILAYGVVALPSPPVVRSVLLCLSIGIGILHRRSIDLVQLLALSAMAMLVYRPLDLFNAGFQLSFGTVLGLILLTQPIVRILDRSNPLDLAPLPPTRRQAIWRTLRMRALQTLAAAIAAWLVSLPLVAYHFDRLNPWAMAGSIVLAPVVFAALIGGFFKVILSLLLPGLATTWAQVAAWPMVAMRHMVEMLERLPASDVPLAAPSLTFIAIYYVALGVPLLVPAIHNRLAPPARLGPIAVCLLLLCLPAWRP